jgi:hypothetical protein
VSLNALFSPVAKGGCIPPRLTRSAGPDHDTACRSDVPQDHLIRPNGGKSLAEHTSIAGGTGGTAIRVIEILCMVVHSAVASPVPAWE